MIHTEESFVLFLSKSRYGIIRCIKKITFMFFFKYTAQIRLKDEENTNS